MSSRHWKEPRNSKVSLSNGFFNNIEFSEVILSATLGYNCLRRQSLKRRSIKSEKGYMPVPPIAITTLPGSSEAKDRPKPLSELKCKVFSLKSWIILVKWPFLYCFISKGS
jgi:hypothetical protein